jgi:hypothetical protein
MAKPHKIDALGLAPVVLQVYNETGCNLSETAKRLSKAAGSPISNMAVKRYLEKIEAKAGVTVEKKAVESKAASNAAAWLDDREKIISTYQAVLTKALVPLRNASSDKEILAAVPVAMSVLSRALDHHRIGGKGDSVEVNVAVQAINLDDEIESVRELYADKPGAPKLPPAPTRPT